MPDDPSVKDLPTQLSGIRHAANMQVRLSGRAMLCSSRALVRTCLAGSEHACVYNGSG